jgi:alkaline phosphatase
MSSSRRRFLKQTGWLSASALGLASVPRSAASVAEPSEAKPRHIIHLVADGMSVGTLTLADHFSRLVRQRGLRWVELCRRPEAALGWVNMRSLNSLVTDSSAASSSWGSGSRVVNGMVNRLPDGRDLRPLYSVFEEAGWKRGLVTTTEITHATPAGFAANASRDDAQLIAAQYLDRKIEVLLGGGSKFFDPAQRKDQRDLRAEYRAQGYVVMQRAPELAAAPLNQRWLGTFAGGHLPFTIDHIADKELLARVPTLVEMTRLALKKLEREDRFLLQVEGGRVDHAAHNCDIAAALRDQLAFDEALEVCLEFQRRAPETLLIVTTDHGTGNPGLNGAGARYKDSCPLFAHVLQINQSCAVIHGRLEKAGSAGEVQRILREATGYQAPAEKAAMLLPFLAKKGKAVYDQMNSSMAQLGQLLANHVGVGWAGGAHTADYVPLLALGPGAARFRGFLQNTDVFRHYVALGGIDFRNPEAPLMAEAGPAAGETEGAEDWV